MIELVDFTEADIDELIPWVQSEEEMILWAGSRFQWPFDHAQMESYMHRRLANNIQYMIFKAIDSQTKAMVGHIELATIDFVNLSATVVHVLVKPALRSQGYGGKMVKKALEIGFDYLHLHRIDMVVCDFNKPAIRCYQKLGFKQEGLMRDSKKVGTGYWSMCLRSLLEDEWKAKKSVLLGL